MLSPKILADVDHFINNEKQFHLGFLPTEQANPKSKNLDKDFQESTAKGVATLQLIDRDVLKMAQKVLVSKNYNHLIEEGKKTIRNHGRIIFSGCGSTGRLSILLESMWRDACHRYDKEDPYADQVESIMTGGDYALVKSVEFFEDYAVFGRRQVEETNVQSKDMLVAITEGGETSSVLGTVDEALHRSASVFLLFNNPADLLRENLERCKKAIEDPRVTVLDLSCGPMAVAGSTRMQATTSELLIAGAALETIFHTIINQPIPDYAKQFDDVLTKLETNRCAIAKAVSWESELYKKGGKVTYYANRFMLDIFTDTTERAPTFMIPPFRKKDDTESPVPWSFVKNPLYSTEETWQKIMNRNLRCLEWTHTDYKQMDAPKAILSNLPQIQAKELLKFEIGNEISSERFATGEDGAMMIMMDNDPALVNEFTQIKTRYKKARSFFIGDFKQISEKDFYIPIKHSAGALELIKHLTIKLVLNTFSTGTMVCVNRVSGNWMSWVSCSNKKLIDRGIRLLMELKGLTYKEGCNAIFSAMDDLNQMSFTEKEEQSPVQYAMAQIDKKESFTDIKH